jgi:hypothetical protein
LGDKWRVSSFVDHEGDLYDHTQRTGYEIARVWEDDDPHPTPWPDIYAVTWDRARADRICALANAEEPD